jgi:hypothetical protein
MAGQLPSGTVTTGTRMNLDEAVDYALSNINARQPNRLGPLTSIDR